MLENPLRLFGSMDDVIRPKDIDSMLRWSKDIEMQADSLSISSERVSGSEYETEQLTRNRPYLEIWNSESIWEGLMVIYLTKVILRLSSNLGIKKHIKC